MTTQYRNYVYYIYIQIYRQINKYNAEMALQIELTAKYNAIDPVGRSVMFDHMPVAVLSCHWVMRLRNTDALLGLNHTERAFQFSKCEPHCLLLTLDREKQCATLKWLGNLWIICLCAGTHDVRHFFSKFRRTKHPVKYASWSRRLKCEACGVHKQQVKHSLQNTKPF